MAGERERARASASARRAAPERPRPARRGADAGRKRDNVVEPREDGLDLYAACERGLTATAEMLIARGAEIEREKPGGWTPLMVACFIGHTGTAKVLLDRGANVDLQASDGWTALMLACQEGHTRAAKVRLCGRGDIDGWTALVPASSGGHTEALKLLLDRGAKVDLQDKKGWTALMSTCEGGCTQAAKLLLDRGAGADLQDSEGWTALMLACREGHTKAAELLLECGAKVDLKASEGWTALMSACQNGHTEAVTLLLDRDAQVDVQDPKCWNALMSACDKGFTAITKLLLDRGAKVDLQLGNGSTALMLACSKGHTEAAELLIDRGAEIDVQRSDGWTALLFASQKGLTETAKVLLDRGAKVGLQLSNGSNALMLACDKGHREAAKLLVDRGADVDLQRTDGWTALMFACQNGRTETAKLLLDRGAEVDLQKTDGWTALMSACRSGHAEVARLLLDRGARVDMQDVAGHTALVRASQGGPSNLEQAEMERRAVSIIHLLCTRSNRVSFTDLGGPAALAIARKRKSLATVELLEFLTESSPLSEYGLPLGTLASFYARNVRTPQAAADLSGPELYFMGLKNSKQRHEAMERFRAAAEDEQSGGDTLGALVCKVEQARKAHKRGQAAIDDNLADLHSLLSLRPRRLAAPGDFELAMDTLRKAKQSLEDLQARFADDVSLVAERDKARDNLASLVKATFSGAFQRSFEQLEKNSVPAATENICNRVWACLSDEPLAILGGPVASEEDAKRTCQAATAAIATWKQREEVILARHETQAAVDNYDPALQALDRVRTSFLWPGGPTRVPEQSTELEAVKDILVNELRALRNDDPIDEVPLIEIRCALELISRQHAAEREVELAHCRAAARALKTEMDELVRSCSKPSAATVEDFLDRIYEVQSQRDVLEMKLRHGRGRWPCAGASLDVNKLAKLEAELGSLPGRVYELDLELRQERARVIRYAERYSPKLVKDPAWRKQIGLPSETQVGLGKLELWLAHVTRADFAQVEQLSIKPGKEVYKVRDPKGREMVLKSVHLANAVRQDHFCRQVQALAELESAYFVRIRALFVDASFGHIMMPYYAGGDLAAWVRDNPHASDQTRERIAVGVLSSVHDLHQRKLVHCDIKAENIFLTETLAPVLAGFECTQMSDLTMARPLEMVDRYVPPELLADGTSKVSPALDLFSVGVVLSEIFPTPSGGLQDLIDKLQAEDPAQRPSSLEALRHETFVRLLSMQGELPGDEGVVPEE